MKRPTVARFAVVSKVPPSITQALSLSERFHQSLCKILESADSAHPDFPQDKEIITGKQYDTGAPMEGGQHVFFLPECDQHGYITHMTLYAPAGFGAVACRIFGKLRKVWGAEAFDVKIVLLATGDMDDFSKVVPYFRKAKTWKSLTPFFPVHHTKKKSDPSKNGLVVGSPAHDCWRLLECVSPSADWLENSAAASENSLPILDVSEQKTPYRIAHGLRSTPCLHFQRFRRTGAGKRASQHGFALQIRFTEKIALPIGLGYAAHFGLGLFVPIEE